MLQCRMAWGGRYRRWRHKATQASGIHACASRPAATRVRKDTLSKWQGRPGRRAARLSPVVGGLRPGSAAANYPILIPKPVGNPAARLTTTVPESAGVATALSLPVNGLGSPDPAAGAE